MKRRKFHWNKVSAVLILIFILVACRQEEVTPAAEEQESTVVLTEPNPTLEATTEETFSAHVATYSLGETTIVQEHFPEDSPFRNMPVRLEGVIGVPVSDERHPVVLIMHGSHASCPGENEWPCSAEEEQKNYEGFTYLVEALAEAGYIALSINVNAEHTFGFGEAPPTIRTKQLIDLHLEELAAAVAGESHNFGLDLAGRADLSSMAWIGHSRGADFVNQIIREGDLHQTASDIGYGPVKGIMLLAPPFNSTDVLPAVDVPTALILPACDWDVLLLAGQTLYESARFDSDRQTPYTSVYLEHGNHNNFNTMLEPDPIIEDRTDCAEEQILAPADQQTFLAQYAVDFLRTAYAGPGEAGPVRQRIGLDPAELVPTELYDHPVQITTLQPAANRLTVLQPLNEDELSHNLLGGEVVAGEIETVFCPEGYYSPEIEPGTEPCQRVNFNQPGYPQLIALGWDSDDAAWRTALPDSTGDLSGYAALQLRAGLDPLSDLNVEGEPLSFSVELVDGSGRRAEVSGISLAYPPGVRQPNEFFEGGWFTGHVTMHTVRIPLQAFGDIDTSNIGEIALLFDQTDAGALFVADLELLKSDY